MSVDQSRITVTGATTFSKMAHDAGRWVLNPHIHGQDDL